jgi:hypothetical protein
MDCHREFTFDTGEQAYYHEHNFYSSLVRAARHGCACSVARGN